MNICSKVLIRLSSLVAPLQAQCCGGAVCKRQWGGAKPAESALPEWQRGSPRRAPGGHV